MKSVAFSWIGAVKPINVIRNTNRRALERPTKAIDALWLRPRYSGRPGGVSKMGWEEVGGSFAIFKINIFSGTCRDRNFYAARRVFWKYVQNSFKDTYSLWTFMEYIRRLRPSTRRRANKSDEWRLSSQVYNAGLSLHEAGGRTDIPEWCGRADRGRMLCVIMGIWECGSDSGNGSVCVGNNTLANGSIRTRD